MATGKKGRGANGKPSIIRALGHLECFHHHMIQMGYLNNTIVHGRYKFPPCLARDQVVEQLEDAVARVVLEHPFLRLDVVNGDTKRPSWIGVDALDFSHHVHWEDVNLTNTEDYNEFLRDRIEKRLDEPTTSLEGRPKWRVLILAVGATGETQNQNQGLSFLDVIFDFSHAIADGISGKLFHETLLYNLNLNTKPPTSTTTTITTKTEPALLTNRILKVPPTARPLGSPIEKLAKFPLTAKYAITAAWKELKPPGSRVTSSTKPTAQATWAPIRTESCRTQFRMFDISAESVQNILISCRAHKTTMTALLHALLLVGMATRLSPSDAVAFTGDTALDLRRHLPVPELEAVGSQSPSTDPKRTMANFISLMEHKFDATLVRKIRALSCSSPPSKEPTPALVDLIWQCATRVRAEIQERLDRGLKNDIVGLMGLVPDWRAQHLDDTRKPRSFSFVVTNLGVLDGVDTPAADVEKEAKSRLDTSAAWTIEHSIFAIPAEVTGAAFGVSPISVKGRELCVACSWQDGVMDVKLGEAMVADLNRWLRFLGE